MGVPSAQDVGLRIFGKGIADDRLFALRGRPAPPEIFADPWGDDVPHFTDEFQEELERMTQEAVVGAAIPVTPVLGAEVSPLAYEPSRVDVFGMGIFNPHGPSLCSVGVLPSRDRRHWCLIESFRHTMFRYDAVHACLPSGKDGRPLLLREALLALLDMELVGERNIQRFAMPDFVLLGDNEFVQEEDLKCWFQSLASLRGFGQASLQSTLSNYTRFGGNPWDRAAEGYRVGTEMAIEQFKSTGSVWPAPEVPLTSDQLDEWYCLVTQSEHVRCELAEIPGAWLGSLQLMRGDFNQ